MFASVFGARLVLMPTLVVNVPVLEFLSSGGPDC